MAMGAASLFQNLTTENREQLDREKAQVSRSLERLYFAVLTHPTLVEGLIPLFSSAASAHNVVERRGAQISAV
jgi:hypothetical protein